MAEGQQTQHQQAAAAAVRDKSNAPPPSPRSPRRQRPVVAARSNAARAKAVTVTTTPATPTDAAVKSPTRASMSIPAAPRRAATAYGAGSGNPAHGARPASRAAAPAPNGAVRHSMPTLRHASSISSIREEAGRRGTTPRTSSSMGRRSSMAPARPPRDDQPAARKGSLAPPPAQQHHGRTSTTRPHIPSPAWKIAEEQFTKELALHRARDMHAKTVVVLQDACYAHRFARPGASRAALESIVERPERLQAVALGVAAAYVLLGERSSAGRHTPREGVDVSKLPAPPFQVRRTSRALPLSAPPVTHVHGAEWMAELSAMCAAAETRLASGGGEVDRLPAAGADKPALHAGDLYLCPQSQEALQAALGAVCEGVDAVFTSKTTRRAFVAARPPGHHCARDFPAGFCWLNNVHVGIAHAALHYGLTHAAIVDFDLHHGDGSQALAWAQNARAARAGRAAGGAERVRVGYFSVHDINSFPCETGDAEKVRDASVCIEGAHGQFVHNVHMAPWKTEEEFWALYEERYAVLIEKARVFLRHWARVLAETQGGQAPKGAIFISAGFDASEYECPGMQRHDVNVPTGYYARLTSDIVKLSQEEGLAVDGRIISVLEGGYSDRALTSGVLSHLSGLTATEDLPIKEDGSDIPEVDRVAEQIKALSFNDPSEPFVYHSEWWSTPCLEQLEVAVHGPSKKAPILKRQKTPPTYSSPTQASVAKAVVPPKDISSRMATWLIIGDISPQEVDWCTAAKELRKLLIPTDRDVKSYDFKDLKAARADKPREKGAVSPVEAHHMNLRDRRPKAPSPDRLRPGSRLSASRTRAESRSSGTRARQPSLPEEAVLPESPGSTASGASNAHSEEGRGAQGAQQTLTRARSNVSLGGHAAAQREAAGRRASVAGARQGGGGVTPRGSAEGRGLRGKASGERGVDAQSARARQGVGNENVKPGTGARGSDAAQREKVGKPKATSNTPAPHTKQPASNAPTDHRRRSSQPPKKVETLISHFNNTTPTTIAPTTSTTAAQSPTPDEPTTTTADSYERTFFYHESSESSEPPGSPPSASASRSASAYSEASPRTVDEFPREEVARQYTAGGVAELPVFTPQSAIPFGGAEGKEGGK